MFKNVGESFPTKNFPSSLFFLLLVKALGGLISLLTTLRNKVYSDFQYGSTSYHWTTDLLSMVANKNFWTLKNLGRIAKEF